MCGLGDLVFPTTDRFCDLHFSFSGWSPKNGLGVNKSRVPRCLQRKACFFFFFSFSAPETWPNCFTRNNVSA